MSCNCKDNNIVTDSNEIMYVKKELLIQLKLDIYKWKTLYKCKVCSVLREESFIEDRFVGIPKLAKVDNDYVKKEW